MEQGGIQSCKNQENNRQLTQFTLFEEDPYSQQISILEQKPLTTQAAISHFLHMEELFMNKGFEVVVQSDSKDIKGQMTAFVSNYRLILLEQQKDGELFKKTINEIPISIPMGYILEIDIIKREREITLKLKTGIMIKLRPDILNVQIIYQTLLKGFMSLPFYAQSILDKQQYLSYDCLAELQRMRINLKSLIVVQNFKGLLCPTYPKYFVIPKRVDHNLLQQCLKLRNYNRIPTVSYYSSQYKSSLWRTAKVKANQQGNKFNLAYLRQISRDLFVVQLKQEENIFRDSLTFKYLPLSHLNVLFKKVVYSYAKNESFFKMLQKWYQEIKFLLSCSYSVAQQLKSGKEVLLVQNNAFDRVPQVSSLTQLLIDPFYRTISGFNILVEKQFMCFGHPFSQRLGFQSSKIHQESPIFVQFLQAVTQLINIYPNCFEFSPFYLARIAYEAYTTKYNNFYFGDDNLRKKYQPMLKSPNIWRSLPMKKQYYNYQWIEKAALVQLTKIRKHSPSIKQFLVWREYYDMLSDMRCQQPNQTQVRHRKNSLYKFINRRNSLKQ